MTEYVIGDADDFEEGRGYQVDIDGIQVALFKADGEFYAVSNRCPHKHAPLHTAGLPKFTERAELEKGKKPDDILDPSSRDPRKHPRGMVNCKSSKSSDDSDGDGECWVSCPHHGLRFDLRDGHNEVTGMQIGSFDVKVDGSELKLVL